MSLTLMTSRLTLRPLTLDDAPFVLEQVNEPGFIQHIGDKGVRSLHDACDYLAGPLTSYEVNGFGLLAVCLRDHLESPIGMCGLVRRDTLPGPDLGYAFLQRFCGRGYAREAAEAVVADARGRPELAELLAITTPDNERSCHLLETVGFRFVKFIGLGERQETMKLYAYSLA